jgi:thymidylate synthase
VKGDVPRTTYAIDKGSFVGSQRLEFEFVVVEIENPGSRPLIPTFPPGVSVPPPVESMEYVEEYFAQYLMNPELQPNETYKYAQWIAPGVKRVIEQLTGAPGNNQAAISIGGWAQSTPAPEKHPEPKLGFKLGGRVVSPSLPKMIDTDNFIDPATEQRDPACLRLLDFRYDHAGKLHVFIYFRSWCLWNGFSANLAGLQLLLEYVASEIGATPGKMICASKGLHLYDYAISQAADRLGMTSVATMEDFVKWLEEKDG